VGRDRPVHAGDLAHRRGKLSKDSRSALGWEIHTSSVKILQRAVDFPISPKEHGPAFLMDNRHLWLRSKGQWAVLRVRHTIEKAIHDFFDARDFIRLDTRSSRPTPPREPPTSSRWSTSIARPT